MKMWTEIVKCNTCKKICEVCNHPSEWRQGLVEGYLVFEGLSLDDNSSCEKCSPHDHGVTVTVVPTGCLSTDQGEIQ